MSVSLRHSLHARGALEGGRMTWDLWGQGLGNSLAVLPFFFPQQGIQLLPTSPRQKEVCLCWLYALFSICGLGRDSNLQSRLPTQYP